MASDSPQTQQRILLVTGMLGAGKTTALRELGVTVRISVRSEARSDLLVP